MAIATTIIIVTTATVRTLVRRRLNNTTSFTLTTLAGLLLAPIEADGDELTMNRGRIPTLFTRVRGRGILRSS
jgi:hypothetical protein